MMNKDLIYELIATLSPREKKQLSKYLQIFEDENYINYPSTIYELYTSQVKYNEKDFSNKSSCKSIGHFRKEKSILKYRILDYLRNFSSDSSNILVEWRRQIDYGSVLKSKGQPFWEEGINILKKTIDECHREFSTTYSFAAYEEASEMFHTLMVKNQSDVMAMIQVQETSILSLNQEFEVFDFYKKVVLKLHSSSFIKSTREEDLFNNLILDKLYSSNANDFYSKGTRYLLLLSICFIATVYEEENNFLLSKSNEFRNLYKSFPENSWYNTFFFKIGYYIGFSNFLTATGRIEELKVHLEESKSFLELTFPKMEDQALYWARYYHSYYTSFCYKENPEKSIINKLIEHIEFFKEKTPSKMTLQFRMILIRLLILRKDYFFALNCCDEILIQYENDSSVFDNKNITKLVQLACIFKLMIQENSFSDRMQETESLAASYYRHFRSLEKEYYQFEIKFCSFFKTLSIKKNKNLKKELIKFRSSIEEIDSNDKFHFLTKLAHHYFDFFKWLDDCIATVK